MNSKSVFWLLFKWLIIPGILGGIGFYLIGPRLDQVPAFRTTKAGADVPKDAELSTSNGYVDLSSNKAEVPEYQDLDIKLEKPGTTKKTEKKKEDSGDSKPSDKLQESTTDEDAPLEPEEDTIPSTPPADDGTAGW